MPVGQTDNPDGTVKVPRGTALRPVRRRGGVVRDGARQQHQQQQHRDAGERRSARNLCRLHRHRDRRAARLGRARNTDETLRLHEQRAGAQRAEDDGGAARNGQQPGRRRGREPERRQDGRGTLRPQRLGHGSACATQRNATNSPGQFTGRLAVDTQVPNDVRSNGISDTAIRARQGEDATAAATWNATKQTRGWANGLPANVTADEKTEYQVDTARERARTDRLYAGSFAKFGAGTLALSFLDGFTFDIGTCDLIGFDSRFVQLGNYACPGLDGDFAANVLCTADGAELSIEAIPEPETARLFSWHRARPVHTQDRMEAADDIEVCDDVLDAASGQAKRDQTGRGVDTGLKDRWDIRLDERPAWANARQQLNEAILVGLRRYLRTSNSRMANRSIEQCCGRSA